MSFRLLELINVAGFWQLVKCFSITTYCLNSPALKSKVALTLLLINIIESLHLIKT